MKKYPINFENGDGNLDGTFDNAHQLLKELVTLADQENAEHALPVLELQFGEILTTSSLIKLDGHAYLAITAMLPKHAKHQYLSPTKLKHINQQPCGYDSELLWHVDQGRYVLLRKLPLSDLTDEMAVLNAIMDSSDHAAVWHAQLLDYFESQ